jgi:hypothetical protein
MMIDYFLDDTDNPDENDDKNNDNDDDNLSMDQ